VAIEPPASLFRDVVFGLNGALTSRESHKEKVFSTQTEVGWTQVLRQVGFVDAQVRSLAGADGGFLCVAHGANAARATAAEGAALIVSGRDSASGETAAKLSHMLAAAGMRATVVRQNELELVDVSDAPTTIVYLARRSSENFSPIKRLAERCLALKRLASNLGAAKLTLWKVSHGATRPDAEISGAIEAGVWAFARSLANETPTLDIRKIDIAQDLSPVVEAERLRDIVLSGTQETEIQLDAAAARVIRFE
jgi:phthiocerol/phenolphthiocerol synthesis type-I polyketide synthase C